MKTTQVNEIKGEILKVDTKKLEQNKENGNGKETLFNKTRKR